MIAALWICQALAGPVPMLTGGSHTMLTGPVPMFPEPSPPVIVPYRTGIPWIPFYIEPISPELPTRAFPPLPAPSGEPTAWQLGKTRIEQPGTFMPIEQLPSAFKPIEPAVDRLHRPEPNPQEELSRDP